MTQNVKPPIAERRRTGRRATDLVAPDFKALVDGHVQGVLIHSNFRPLYANEAFAKLFGYKNAAEILALPLVRPLVPTDMWARVEEEYGALIRGEREMVITRARGVRKDGAEIWLAVTEQLVDWQGTPAVKLSAFDITSQVAVEHGMQDSEQRLRAMLEILPVPIYIARRNDGQLLFVNRKTCLLFQQSAGPLLRGKSVDFFVDPQERENLRVTLEQLPDIREVEVKMRTASGREFIAELAAIVMDYSGEPAILVSLNDISQRKQLEAELFQQATTDSLTNLNNRRHFMDGAEQELRRARRFARDLSVLMIDIDHFKKINDTHGHAVGDLVLQGMAKASLESLRHSDVMGRLGGEEFAVLMPETGLEAAAEVANRLRQHIANQPIITVKAVITCTVSIGVAQLTAQDQSVDALLQRADDAMYRAKQSGRNRVEKA